jgi:hypothetical protein
VDRQPCPPHAGSAESICGPPGLRFAKDSAPQCWNPQTWEDLIVVLRCSPDEGWAAVFEMLTQEPVPPSPARCGCLDGP